MRQICAKNDPELQSLHRKRVSVPPMKPSMARRKYAADVAAEINAKLSKGWNPFLALTNPNSYVLFRDVCEKYFRYLYKLTEDGIMRIKTYNGYTSFLNVFSAWNDRQETGICSATALSPAGNTIRRNISGTSGPSR